MDKREEYEQALIDWAQCYNGYERIAGDSERLHQVYGPLRQETLERDEIPSGIGVDLLRGWAFYIARVHRWSGCGSIFEDFPEFESIAEAVRNHPAATPEDLPPSPADHRKLA